MPPLNPKDVITVTLPHSTHKYFVEGVFYGALACENVVHLWPASHRSPTAYGKDVEIFVPVEMIESGIAAGIFTLSPPVNKQP